jgi:hypothetical protein
MRDSQWDRQRSHHTPLDQRRLGGVTQCALFLGHPVGFEAFMAGLYLPCQSGFHPEHVLSSLSTFGKRSEGRIKRPSSRQHQRKQGWYFETGHLIISMRN